MNRKMKILSVIQDLSNKMNKENNPSGWTASEIAAIADYSRNNVSTELNNLADEGKVSKIDGRPVRFLILQSNQEQEEGKQRYFGNQEAFQSFCEQQAPNFTNNEEVNLISNKYKAFTNLVGYDRSMKTQVKQAMASIMYPPSGLDTLLIGESGVGKTTFAQVMYDFAQEATILKKDAPFIVFNCADYSENTQLLLSQLFGHAKGAFTGADTEKEGLVDQAHTGILFLDEVHRLPPEGQEMLFSLMDRGEFRRLGETKNIRKADVLILAATTENLDTTMLHTFLRRIPNKISLPNLKQRSLKERMELVVACFRNEAIKINKTIQVSSEVIKFFLVYECKHNIGQLSNDIQLICASAFVEMLAKNMDKVFVKLSQLPSQYIELFDVFDEKREELSKEFSGLTNRHFTFAPDAEPSSISNSLVDKRMEKNFYQSIENVSKKYFEKGLNIDEVTQLVDNEVIDYFKEHNFFHYPVTPENENPIYKLISKKDYTFISGIIISVFKKYGLTIKEQAIIGLVLHISSLIERIQEQQPLKKARLDNILGKDTLYFDMALKVVEEIEQEKRLKIPTFEISFIAIFFESLTLEADEQKVAILVMTHGQIAKELALVANTLLKETHAQYLCMPLDEKVTSVLASAKEKVKDINQGKGVLLLVDMGSLSSFGPIISEETDIDVRTVTMVSTLTVLEATRLSLMNTNSLDTIMTDLENMTDYTPSKISDLTLHQDKLYSGLNHAKNPKFLNLIEEILTFINPKKAVDSLTEVYIKILHDLNRTESESLYIKFIFHSSSMIERTIQGENYHYNHFEENMLPYKELFSIISKQFEEINNIWGIEIPQTELAYLVELFAFSNSNIFEKIIDKSTIEG